MSTEDLLRVTMPHADAAVWSPVLDTTFKTFSLTTPIRQACFLGQVAVESTELRVLEEDLNYTAARLTQVWHSHFPTLESAGPYAGNPERIANHVYAMRNGNGDEASGDGWNYRGRGLIQTTGKTSYAKTQDDLLRHGISSDLIGHPYLLAQPLYAALSAGAYWEWAGLNNIADRVPGFGAPAFSVLTRRINGGVIGLASRAAYANRAFAYLTGK